jgi:hypothetical protein
MAVEAQNSVAEQDMNDEIIKRAEELVAQPV